MNNDLQKAIDNWLECVDKGEYHIAQTWFCIALVRWYRVLEQE